MVEKRFLKMANEYIGSPKDFHNMDGGTLITFRKTFNLNGTENDEMLQLYLRKAGLSDEIERLTVDQRRAFIYDIIKSNKMPGYWVPSTMQDNYYDIPRPLMKAPTPPPPLPPSPPLPPPPISFATSSPNFNNHVDLPSNVLNINLQDILPEPMFPPQPAKKITRPKGKKLEISGPFGFQHTAGEMHRDMSHNAFDLSASNNDNVLRKYMIERGIKEEDICGISKNDIVQKIVQSKFTWMPARENNSSHKSDADSAGKLRLNYATISGYPNNANSTIRQRPALNIPNSPKGTEDSKPKLSNFELITSRFADVEQFPSPFELKLTNAKPHSNIDIVALPPLPTGAKLPAPPPRKSQYSSATLPTKKNRPPLPLPLATHSTPTNDGENHSKTDFVSTKLKDQIHDSSTINEIQTKSKDSIIEMPPTVPPLTRAQVDMHIAKANAISNKSNEIRPTPPVPPPKSKALQMNRLKIAKTNVVPIKSSELDPSTSATPITPVKSSAKIKTNKVAAIFETCTLPPEKPHIASFYQKEQHDCKKSSIHANEEFKGALMMAIQKGVPLKKTSKKPTIISDVKPCKAEQRPAAPIFLSELKAAASRRIEHEEDNV